MDIYKVFNDVFQQTSFDSFKIFAELLHQFMNRTGYLYRIKTSRIISNQRKCCDTDRFHELRYAFITYVCTQQGQPKGNRTAKRLHKYCEPVGCKSFLSLSSATGLLRIIKFNLEHNHKSLAGFAHHLSKLTKKEIKNTAVLNQYKMKYKVQRKKKQKPVSASVPTAEDSLVLPSAAKVKKNMKQNSNKKKKNTINKGELVPKSNSQIENTQEAASQIVSGTEHPGNIAYMNCIAVASAQQSVSQPNPVENSQSLQNELFPDTHSMPAWKKKKLCNSSVYSRSPTAMAKSLKPTQTTRSVSSRTRKSSPVLSNHGISHEPLHSTQAAAKVTMSEDAVEPFKKPLRKNQYFQDTTEVERRLCRGIQATAKVSNDTRCKSKAPNKVPSSFPAATCINLDDLPSARVSSVLIDARQTSGNSYSSNVNKKSSDIPSQSPICVINDIETLSQLPQFSQTPPPVSQSQPFEIPQPPGKKIFILADHQKNVMSSLALLWKSRKLCDAGIGNGLSTVMVHKIVLAAVCPKLLSVFGADMLSQKFLQINLPAEVGTEALNAFAEYLYNGALDLDPNILHQLKIIAKQLDMKEFEQLCDSQLATIVYHPQYNQIPTNVSSLNINIPAAHFSSPSSVQSPLSKRTGTTQVIHINDEISEIVTENQESQHHTSAQQPEVSSLDASKKSKSSDNIYIIVPSGQARSVARESNRNSLLNYTPSNTSPTNIKLTQNRRRIQDSSAAYDKIFVMPFSDTTDSRTSNIVQNLNPNSNVTESSQSYDLSPVSCIVQKMCSQPSLIGRNFYKPAVQPTSKRSVFIPSSSIPKENVSLQLAADVVSIDLTDEIT